MKRVYTTGDVARICNVTIRTVIKWFESGELKGFKIPNSRDRRIPRENLIAFMQKHGMPLQNIDLDNRRRILVADDEDGILFVLKKFLGDIGIFDIETASSGLETGMKLTSFRPHLLLLDHLLGDTTSNEVVRNVSQNPDLNSLKIIIMSGYVSDDEVAVMLQEGIDDFIRKPFDLEEVKTKVFQLLELA
ncbi:MAG: response regulator [Planctomycetes bacterium]|nr:response regulator [Planctomycetota bacterium]